MHTDNFAHPREQRYFEDYVVGAVHEFGAIRVGEQEIIEFAERYDPQPMHTDTQAATATPAGELIASGWHTAGLMMRLYVEHYLSSVATLASPGVDELRWPAPLRPGDELSARITVVSARRSRSKPDRGIVTSAIEVLNQNGVAVMTMTALNLFLCRDPSPAAD